MVDYSLGKVYKITGGDLTYIGSTVQPLSKRFWGHKTASNKTSSKQIIEFEDCCITLIENYPCNTKEELHARERFWIENTVCVNKFIPNRTQEENVNQHKIWVKNNKEKIRETLLIYREANKDKIQQHQKEYYEERKEEIQEKRRPYHEEYRLLNRETINANRRNCNLTEEQQLRKKELKRASYHRNKENRKEHRKEYHLKTKEIAKQQSQSI